MKVYAIIVAYHPDATALLSLARTLVGTGARVVVVDNTPGPHSSLPAMPEGCEIVALGDNTGIAHAQNIGIRLARERAADVIAFFDQDSTIGVAFLPTLIDGLAVGEPGVVGPACIDALRGFEYPSYRLNRWGYPVKVRAGSRVARYPVDLLISSGSAVTAVTFDVVGLQDEDFFIDCVDQEWSLRCRALGVPIMVNPQARMAHSIGDVSSDIGPLRTFVHSPARRYYRVRNAFLLLRKRHVPKLFACKAVLSAVLHSILQLGMVSNRSEHLRIFCVGALDGIRGVKGRMAAAR